MGNNAITVFAAAAALTTGVDAQIMSVDPFTGDATETWETIAPPGPTPGPVDILDDQATAHDTLTNNVMIAFNLVSFETGEEIFARNGNFMAGAPTGWFTVEFDTPVEQFGTYIGTVDVVSGGQVSFFDDADNVIGTVPLDLPLNEWQWHGWRSDQPFSRIEIQGDPTPGTPIVLDDTQANFVPAPGSVGLLAMGGVAALRRRR